MIFPNDNLPRDAKPWAREITKQVSGLIDTTTSESINNANRDSQMNSALISVASALIDAQQAIADVTAVVNNIYVDGTTTLDGSVLASGTVAANKLVANSITSTQISTSYVYAGTINASQITAGTISGDKITGGTITGSAITGGSLSTSGTRHVEVTGTSVYFYNSSGNNAGNITASGTSTITIQATGGAFFSVFNGGAQIYGDGNNSITLSNNVIDFGTSQMVGTVPSGWQGSEGAYFGTGALVVANVGTNSASFSRASNNGPVVFFYRGTTTNVGSIDVTTTATAYTTSSDYRLKENVTPITGAIDRIKLLKPSRFNFKIEPDEVVDGFIAHEAQEVVPEAVRGNKDAVDENGTPVYQSIDQSKLMPLAIAAIKELTSRVEALEGN